jgi:hypothetical protein
VGAVKIADADMQDTGLKRLAGITRAGDRGGRDARVTRLGFRLIGGVS